MITLKRDNVIKVVDSQENSQKLQKEGFQVISNDEVINSEEGETVVTKEDPEGSIENDENEEAGEGKKHGRGNKKDSK